MNMQNANQTHHCIQERLPISIVIVNYNAGPLLTDCVAMVSDTVNEIIVIDNASTDNSLKTLASQFSEQPHILLIQNDTNMGFAKGCNKGLEISVSPYILFLNPDCKPENKALHRMLQILKSDPHIGMVGGQITNPDGTEQGGARRDIPTPWRAFVRATGLYRLEKFWPTVFPDFHLHKKPLPDKPIEVEATSGAMMLVRREALEAVGGWDEGYFLHCEDLDLCMQLRQKGWKIVFVPDAKALHYQGTCSKARPFFVAWHKHRGMMRSYRKFFDKQYSVFLMGLVTCGVWLRFMLTVVYHAARHVHRILKPGHG